MTHHGSFYRCASTIWCLRGGTARYDHSRQVALLGFRLAVVAWYAFRLIQFFESGTLDGLRMPLRIKNSFFTIWNYELQVSHFAPTYFFLHRPPLAHLLNPPSPVHAPTLDSSPGCLLGRRRIQLRDSSLQHTLGEGASRALE